MRFFLDGLRLLLLPFVFAYEWLTMWSDEFLRREGVREWQRRCEFTRYTREEAEDHAWNVTYHALIVCGILRPQGEGRDELR